MMARGAPAGSPAGALISLVAYRSGMTEPADAVDRIAALERQVAALRAALDTTLAVLDNVVDSEDNVILDDAPALIRQARAALQAL